MIFSCLWIGCWVVDVALVFCLLLSLTISVSNSLSLSLFLCLLGVLALSDW